MSDPLKPVSYEALGGSRQDCGCYNIVGPGYGAIVWCDTHRASGEAKKRIEAAFWASLPNAEKAAARKAGVVAGARRKRFRRKR